MVSYNKFHIVTVSTDIIIIFCRVEKYRPNSLDDLVSHEDIIKTGSMHDILSIPNNHK